MLRPYPTIVSGLPRSGTSLMMRMLEAGGIPALTDGARAPDADNPRGYYEFEPVKRTAADASWLGQAGGRAVKMVHLLLPALPAMLDCRIVFMRRRMEEVVASQAAMLARLGRPGGGLAPEALARLYEDQLRRVEAVLAERPSFRVIRVSYNDLIREPAPTIDAVAGFLGGPLDTESMVREIDPTLYRQRG